MRVIGDEILHIITYKNEHCLRQYYKSFDVICGIATVYRKDLGLEDSPRINYGWLLGNAYLYGRHHRFDLDKKYMHSISEFEYEAESEESLIASVKHSLEVTQKIALPILDGVTTLKACVEYYRIMGFDIPNICGEDGLGGADENEGLINFKAYSIDEYIQVRNEAAQYWDRYYTLTKWKRGEFPPIFMKRLKRVGKNSGLDRLSVLRKEVLEMTFLQAVLGMTS